MVSINTINCPQFLTWNKQTKSTSAHNNKTCTEFLFVTHKKKQLIVLLPLYTRESPCSLKPKMWFLPTTNFSSCNAVCWQSQKQCQVSSKLVSDVSHDPIFQVQVTYLLPRVGTFLFVKNIATIDPHPRFTSTNPNWCLLPLWCIHCFWCQNNTWERTSTDEHHFLKPCNFVLFWLRHLIETLFALALNTGCNWCKNSHKKEPLHFEVHSASVSSVMLHFIFAQSWESVNYCFETPASSWKLWCISMNSYLLHRNFCGRNAGPRPVTPSKQKWCLVQQTNNGRKITKAKEQRSKRRGKNSCTKSHANKEQTTKGTKNKMHNSKLTQRKRKPSPAGLCCLKPKHRIGPFLMSNERYNRT